MNNDLDFKEIGKRIQKCRTDNKMTQEKLAELVGTTQKYISRIEAGNHRLHLDTIAAIAKALHVPVDSFIADYANSNDENNLKMILDDIRGMTPRQLDMLKENIATIKKFNK